MGEIAEALRRATATGAAPRRSPKPAAAPPPPVPAGATRITPAAGTAEALEPVRPVRTRRKASTRARKQAPRTASESRGKTARRKTTRKKASTRKSAARSKTTSSERAAASETTPASEKTVTTTLDAARVDQNAAAPLPKKTARVRRAGPSVSAKKKISRVATLSQAPRSTRVDAEPRPAAPVRPRRAAPPSQKTILLPTAPPTPIGLPIPGTPQAQEAFSPTSPLVPAAPAPETPPPAGAIAAGLGAARAPSSSGVARDGNPVALRPRPGALALEAAHLEQGHDLALSVCAQLDARGVHTLAITSAARQEGRTTFVCNLTVALARIADDLRIALVDLDLRRPAIAQLLGINRGCGIETVLAGRAPLETARVSVEAPGFDVFPAYSPQRSAHEVLAQPSFADAMGQLRERYDIVLIDTPPTSVPDPALVLAHGAACLPIARVGRTRARSFERMLGMLPRDQIIGEVLNDERSSNRAGDPYDHGAFGARGEGVDRA